MAKKNAMLRGFRMGRGMFQYVIRAKASEAGNAAKEIEEARAKVKAAYAKLCRNSKDVLEMGRVVARPRSVMVEVGNGTRLNVLSDALAKCLKNEGVTLPYWS